MFLANWSLTLCLFPAAARCRKRGGSSCPRPPHPLPASRKLRFRGPSHRKSSLSLQEDTRTRRRADHLRLLSRNFLCSAAGQSFLFAGTPVVSFPSRHQKHPDRNAGPTLTERRPRRRSAESYCVFVSPRERP